jgi:hypothetical protein
MTVKNYLSEEALSKEGERIAKIFAEHLKWLNENPLGLSATLVFHDKKENKFTMKRIQPWQMYKMPFFYKVKCIIKSKWKDIKEGLRIIFKGEY